MSHALLTTAEMAEADRLAIAGGIPGAALMENAGKAVADAVTARWSRRPVLVACGPGNNGGDGWVAARHLAAAGWPVTVATDWAIPPAGGDAAAHAARWAGEVVPLAASVPAGTALVIDALFGAGLNRGLPAAARRLLERSAAAAIPIVAVDVPSGISGDSGADLGGAVASALTVTFFRLKPGHYLLPARALCGEVVLADIGIPATVLDQVRPRCRSNAPVWWLNGLPRPAGATHKYGRGHLLVAGSAEMTGAARLAARGARRVGAGLVTIAAPARSTAIYAADQPGTLIRTADDAAALAGLLGDRRFNSVVIGPGLPDGAATAALAIAALAAGRATVLDAGALTAFAGALPRLCETIAGPTVMTPHEGEFARLFGALPGGKPVRAVAAARRTGAIVLLKGGDTVIAHPDGRTAINANAPPWLATAGAGDVLAGLVGGLLAQGMPAFEAAAAATWLHGAAASAHGPGLIAEDLPEMLPVVLRTLQ